MLTPTTSHISMLGINHLGNWHDFTYLVPNW
jgi:hypothetical protein